MVSEKNVKQGVKRGPIFGFDRQKVRDISVEVYKARLDDASPGSAERMLTKDADGGAKLRERAGSYDPLTRHYMRALGVKP